MKKYIATVLTCCLVLKPTPARADLFGGDIVVLTQILIQSIETVLQLKAMLENGQDTLSLLRDVNSGIASGLQLIHIIDPHFNPGVYGDLRDPNSVLRAVQDIYGKVPKDGGDHDLMESQDQSVAEVISMNRNLYDYADQVDREKERILFHADQVSPQGAGKLQNQALAVLIGVTTQLLRTQSQLLKLTAQNMAMQNRREKISTESFHQNYEGISIGIESLPKDITLPKLQGGIR